MNATAAKFDLKKANATQLNDHLADLQAKAADHNTPDAELDKVHQDITATFAAIRNLKKTRSAELDGIKAKQDIFGFSIKEIFGDNALTKFSDHELTLEAQHRGLFKPKAEKAATGDKPKQEKKDRVFESDKNPVFIRVPRNADDHQRTADVVIHQGRTKEFYQGKQIFAAIGIPLQRLKGKDVKETERNIAKFIEDNADNKKYAESPDGKAELTKIAEFTFNYVDPKKKDKAAAAAAEPHNEAQADMKDKAAA